MNYGARRTTAAMKLLYRELSSSPDSFIIRHISQTYSSPAHLKKSRVKTFGIRSQLLELNRTNGSLVDDFVLENTDGVFRILNGVSPSLTTAFSFAKYL